MMNARDRHGLMKGGRDVLVLEIKYLENHSINYNRFRFSTLHEPISHVGKFRENFIL
jgi:hypothetical protein